MSEKKQINIDMGLFNFSGKTRKKNPGSEKTNSIKIKQPSQKKKNDSLKKKSILKMIRQHQEERYKNLFDENRVESNKQESNNFNKDFEEAQKFMQNLTEKTSSNMEVKNKTLRQYHSTPNSLLYHPTIDQFSNSTPVPFKDVTNSIVQGSNNTSSILLKPVFNNSTQQMPQYGCLKNGQLPTYRNYMNKTQKVYTTPGGASNHIHNSGIKPPEKTTTDIRNEIIESKLNESMNRVNQMKQTELKLQQLKQNYKPKKMKRKKIIRRTYKVGKSNILPKVAVLVSNKTIRNNITTKSQLLKQTPIEEVKRHLTKYGLIKVGTIAPNDVLRKMYETSVLMCGELYNHNPDNLLHNYVNGGNV
jgi:hypothetical protein